MSEKINIRVDYKLKSLMQKVAKEYNTTLTELLQECFLEQHKNVKLQCKKDFNAVKRKIKMNEELAKRKETNHSFYLIRNTWKTIMKLTIPRLYRMQSPNWKLIKHEIKMANKIYKQMPPYVQKLIKEDMADLDRLTEIKLVEMCSHRVEAMMLEQKKQLEKAKDVF